MSMNKNTNTEASEKDVWLYSTGNFANNIIFMMVSLYVMYYYTNILGISALAAGTIFMVARLVDAVTDPIMGAIVDRTNTKMGKYRPFITFGAPFLGIAFVMLFTTPDLGPTGKVIYAYVSYIFYSLTWTCVQIPQLALPIMLSNDVARRTKIQAIFQAFGAVASLVVQSFALPMLDAFGGQDNPQAWTKLIILYSVVATVIFILSAASVRKLDVYNPNSAKKKAQGQKLSFKDSVNAIVKNRALLCVLLAYGTDMFASQISNSVRMYFFKYNMGGRTDLISYIGYMGTIAAFAMLFFIGPFVKKLGKRVGIAIVEALCLILTLPLLFGAPSQNVFMVMLSLLSTTFLFNITNTMSRSAVLDAANYAEVKQGVACNALVSSTFTFVNKCCQAFSAFFAGAILESTGYNAELTQQAPSTLNAILYLMTLVPIAAYIFSLIGMWFYPLNRKDEIEMQEKIMEIRAKNLEESARG